MLFVAGLMLDCLPAVRPAELASVPPIIVASAAAASMASALVASWLPPASTATVEYAGRL